MKQLHPGVALLEEEQTRNRILRQVWLEDRASALVLERELRGIRAAMRHCDSP
jgi:hypothetical protein